jgi:hypothetical protein
LSVVHIHIQNLHSSSSVQIVYLIFETAQLGNHLKLSKMNVNCALLLASSIILFCNSIQVEGKFSDIFITLPSNNTNKAQLLGNFFTSVFIMVRWACKEGFDMVPISKSQTI